MSTLLAFIADLLAVVVLTFGAYYRRHRRRDMVLAFLGMNVGVLAVCAVLAGVSVGVGVGLGLFGVLAIVRLRSSELTQQEVAYYFAALALGLISGLQPDPLWLSPLLSALIVLVFVVVDNPAMLPRQRRQIVTLDTVYRTESALISRLTELLDARVDEVVVLRTDLVRDLTEVDVRYRLHRTVGSADGPERDARRPFSADPPAAAETVGTAGSAGAAWDRIDVGATVPAGTARERSVR